MNFKKKRKQTMYYFYPDRRKSTNYENRVSKGYSAGIENVYTHEDKYSSKKRGQSKKHGVIHNIAVSVRKFTSNIFEENNKH